MLTSAVNPVVASSCLQLSGSEYLFQAGRKIVVFILCQKENIKKEFDSSFFQYGFLPIAITSLLSGQIPTLGL